ncbi:helix-turn-helix transcriptional regulator [uncultured Clostridium sp.]|uniref:helix-turn-helix domain-containing protein n=1 Tax=uncultured Clostridium sp. TaxID=59620 RepID=UPI0028E637D8|nr:helix-turn-helix transcriptional regulator [uncultured Clostridium sp.]
MNNEKCPKCNGILVKMFNDEKLIVKRCPLCNFEKPNDDYEAGEYKNYEWTQKVFKENKKKLMDDGYKIITVSYLKSIREYRGISQKEIGEILGFTEQRYGNVERHYNAPSIILIAEFAQILDFPIGELYKPVLVSKETYNELKYLKIDKNELVPFEELKDVIQKMDICKNTNEEEYIKLKKQYDEIVNNNFTSLFLKKGEVVEDYYWEEYLDMKGLKPDSTIKL